MSVDELLALIQEAMDDGSVVVTHETDVATGVLSAGGQQSPVVFAVLRGVRGGDPALADRQVVAVTLDDAEVLARQLSVAVDETRLRLKAMEN